jgi:hypothetical protein
MWTKIKCFLGFHEYTKILDGGSYIKVKCFKCGKVRDISYDDFLPFI